MTDVLNLNLLIARFIADEVRRQGHVTPDDHTLRCMWMGQAWQYAMALWADGRPLTEATICSLAARIEPHVNDRGFRQGGVRVGDWLAPPAEGVPRLVDEWVDAVGQELLTPDEAYEAFERIHPFLDGNGRTGKIIHNWMNGTLQNPVLVQDFFGHGVP